jgi:glutamyl-tRNA synthetase
VAGKPGAPPAAVAAAPAAKAVQAKVSTLPLSANTSDLSPLQMAINPNLDLIDRPVVALTVAILTNTTGDLNITSDHKARHSALGLEEGGSVVGDLAMARYLGRRASSPLLGIAASGQASVDAWVDYAQSLMQLAEPQRIKAVAMTLEHACATRTYLVGYSLSLADIALFAALGFPAQSTDRTRVMGLLSADHIAAKRWMTMMASCPAIQEATQLAVGVANGVEAVFDDGYELEPLVAGMNLLEGATPGRVVTRFPPEPSGYLHVGHAKAVLLNDYYARRYQGRLIVRFDDTNPTKEKEEYQQAIVEDLALLGVKPDVVTYTSDYFEAIRGYAIYMIENGIAYMDDTPQEQMKAERAERIESKHRNQTPADARKYFDLMCSGKEDGSTWCLRCKMDMSSDNGTMRDPVLFRQNTTPHHRSGTTYKAYPTYDLACPIVDSLEGVTHALRTTEYNDRDAQYQWILKALGLRRVRIHSFARMNFMYTVLSKRKLTWFVENGHVSGWDDARFPTVRGVVRRGIHLQALRNFIYSQGASRRVVNMEWNKFWAENKKEIDKQAKRFMAINKADNVELTITNGPEESSNSYLESPLHPKDPSLGSRVVRLSKQVLLETVDVDGITVGETIVLMRWGVVKISKIDGGLEGEFVPDGDFKAAKRKLSWMAKTDANPTVILTEFDNLISKEKLEEEDKFEDFINPDTQATTEAIGDAGLKALQEHEIIQLERRGYYRVDRPYISSDKPLILYMIPDGKSKAMSGLSGKLAHR